MHLSKTIRDWPWLTVQIICANIAVIVALAAVWYLAFLQQSSDYSDRLMATFNIEPGVLHAMYVDDVERQLWRSVLIAFLAAIAAAVGLALLIVRPLRALTAATEKLRNGDYSVRSDVRAGEIGELAETINALAAALETEDRRRAQYMADLSHELRTPITTLRGYTEGLEDGVFEADARYFALMSDELRHLTALTQTIDAMQMDGRLSVAEDEAEPIPVGKALRNAVARWDTRFRTRDLDLDIAISDALSHRIISVPPSVLRQILDNLLSNMVRYAGQAAPCRIEGVTGARPDEVCLTFCNHAPDIDEDVLPLLFDRFFRVSANRGKVENERPSGLGLSIVKQRCLSNRGRVDAALQDGELEITVVLPLAPVPVKNTRKGNRRRIVPA